MLRIERVDYLDPIQMADLLMLLDRYAQDPMGGAEPYQQNADKICLALYSNVRLLFP